MFDFPNTRLGHPHGPPRVGAVGSSSAPRDDCDGRATLATSGQHVHTVCYNGQPRVRIRPAAAPTCDECAARLGVAVKPFVTTFGTVKTQLVSSSLHVMTLPELCLDFYGDPFQECDVNRPTDARLRRPTPRVALIGSPHTA